MRRQMFASEMGRLESMRCVYEVRAANPEAPLTDDEVKFIVFAAAEEMGFRAPGRPGGKRLRPETVRLWLEDPAAWSPFVDDVAIQRALAFDWDVIEALSHLEVRVFIERLAEMEDPFEVEGNDPHRFAAWMRGPVKTRVRIMEVVDRARRLVRQRERVNA